MKAMCEVEFEYLFLKDANLKPCIGCYNCMAKCEDKCPLKDDRVVIERKLVTADGFILSSPVYVSNVSWLMKIFIDRFAYMNHRSLFHRQKMLTVVNIPKQDVRLRRRNWPSMIIQARILSDMAYFMGLYAFKIAFLKLFFKYLLMGDHSK